MKAKRYYVQRVTWDHAVRSRGDHKVLLHARDITEHTADPSECVYVLSASALSKVIEQAAKAIAARYGDKDCAKTSQRWRDEYLADARAAYGAGGFES